MIQNLEQFCWVVTPSCHFCNPNEAQKHRFPCLGCDKPIAQIKDKQENLNTGKKNMRLTQINELKQQGFTLAYIAKALTIPRSTVFYILKQSGRSEMIGLGETH
jgi:hypothetical protein